MWMEATSVLSFGIKLCMMDRGAGLSWLSQYHYYQAGGEGGTVLEIKLSRMVCSGVEVAFMSATTERKMAMHWRLMVQWS